MPARIRARHQDEIRYKIQASQLVNRLTDHALGIIELSQTQVRAIEILLRKCVPDLSSVEHSGEVTNWVMALPEPAGSADEWAQQTETLQ